MKPNRDWIRHGDIDALRTYVDEACGKLEAIGSEPVEPMGHLDGFIKIVAARLGTWEAMAVLLAHQVRKMRLHESELRDENNLLKRRLAELN